MRKQLKSLVKTLMSPPLDATGVYERRIRRITEVPGTWTIVMYHRVVRDRRDDPFGLGMCVRLDRFERQIRYFSSRFHILPVGDAVRRIEAGETLPPRALSITFDDGYLDNLTLALPVLRRHGAACSLYVPVGGLQEGEVLWWDRVIGALARTSRRSIDLCEVGLPVHGQQTLQIKGLNAALHVEHILELLWALDMPERDRAVQRIVESLAPFEAGPAHPRRLSSLQVLEMRRQGMEIGAHSVHHSNLEIASDAVVREEMQQSRAYLEQLLQEPVEGFAFPGGRRGDKTVHLARQTGFSYALSTVTGCNRPAFDLMQLRRIGMPDAELADFRRAFSGALARSPRQPRSLFG